MVKTYKTSKKIPLPYIVSDKNGYFIIAKSGSAGKQIKEESVAELLKSGRYHYAYSLGYHGPPYKVYNKRESKKIGKTENI